MPPRQRRAAGNATAALEEVEVVHHDEGMDFVAPALGVCRGFLRTRAGVAELDHFAQDHPFADDCGERIYNGLSAWLGILLLCRISAATLPAPQVPLIPPAMPR